MSEYIGNRIVPRHDGVWDSGKTYEPLTIVLEEGTGDSYISRKDVPAGTGLNQKEYWAMCQRFSEQVQLFREAVDADVSDMKKLTDDTVAAINQKAADTIKTVNQKADDTLETMTQRTSTAEALTNSNKAELESRMDEIEKRQDANVAASTDKNADYAAELVDARVDSNGTTYSSLGARLRNREYAFLYRNMVGLYLAKNSGQIIGSHQSYKGNCTDKIVYKKQFGSIQVERGNLVFHNSYIETIAFYDDEETFISGYNQESELMLGDFFAVVPEELIPDGTAYFAVSLQEAGTSVWFRFSNADWYDIVEMTGEIVEEKLRRDHAQFASLLRQPGNVVSCSKNLLDVNSLYVLKGCFLGGNGDIRENEQYAISGYIPVVPGVEYIYMYGTGGASCAVYDAEFQFIQSFQGGDDLTIPENGAFVRLSFQQGSTTAMFLEKRYDTSQYEAYCNLYTLYQKVEQDRVDAAAAVADKLSKQKSKNLFDKDSDNIIRERYLGSKGGIGTNAAYFISDYIEVEPGETYYPYKFGAGGAYHCVYGEDQKTIVAAFKDEAITIPEDGRYVRLSGLLSGMEQQQFEKGDSFTGYEAYTEYLPLEFLKETVEELEAEVRDPEVVKNKLDRKIGKNRFDKNAEGIIWNSYLTSNGSASSNDSYFISDFIPVEEGETYCNYSFGAGGAYHCIYQADKKTVICNFKEAAVTIPEGGAYVRLSGQIVSMDTAQFEKGDTFTGYEDYTEYSPCYENTKRIRQLESDVSDIMGGELSVVLPKTLYFCAGTPLSVYYENILYKSLNDPADLYCSQATPYTRLMNFLFEQAEMGSMEMCICKALKKISEQVFQYEAVAPETLGGKNVRLLFVGDSFTDIGSYVTETKRLIEENGAAVELIGTCGSSKFKAEGLSGGNLGNTFLNTSAGVARIVQVSGVTTAPNTGYPGRTYQDDNGTQWTIRGSKIDADGNGRMVVTRYSAKETDFANFPEQGTLTKVSSGGEGDETIHYSSARAAYHNPFINPESGELDILYYLQEWEFATPDVVVFQFTWNDAGVWLTDYRKIVSNFKQAVDHVHENLPDAGIVISIEPFGSVYSGRDWNGKKYTVLNLVQKLCEVFETEEYESFCKIAPAYACVDLIYGYSSAKVTPNSRYTDQTEISAGDGVHPGTGMLQIADCLYPVITKLMEE